MESSHAAPSLREDRVSGVRAYFHFAAASTFVYERASLLRQADNRPPVRIVSAVLGALSLSIKSGPSSVLSHNYVATLVSRHLFPHVLIMLSKLEIYSSPTNLERSLDFYHLNEVAFMLIL